MFTTRAIPSNSRIAYRRGTMQRAIAWFKGKAMARKSKRERMQRVRSIVADIITDGLEEALFANLLTRDEVNTVYQRIAHQLGIWDLVPRRICIRPDPEEVKERIRVHLKNAGVKVSLPDPQTPTSAETDLASLMRSMLVSHK